MKKCKNPQLNTNLISSSSLLYHLQVIVSVLSNAQQDHKRRFFMASIPSTLSRQRTFQLLPAIVKLAGWRLRQMWHVLFVTWLGVVAMVVLACAIPLFSQVAMTSGLRNALSSAPPNEQRLTFSLLNGQPSPTLISQARQDIDQAVRADLASYVNGAV